MKPPILLFGLPRSGTTWVGKILDSHPQTLYRHEPDSVRRLSMPLFPDASEASEAWASEIRALVADMPHMRESKVVGKTPLFPKAYLSSPAFAMKRMGILSAKVGGRLNSGFPVPFLPRAERSGHGRIVWKSIESLGRLGVVLDALDGAVAIHLMRHPCGYISSVLRGEASRTFTDNRPSSDDYGLFEMLLAAESTREYGLTLDALRELTPEERLAWRWLLINEKAFEDTAAGGRAKIISYDALCRDPERVGQEMFQFVGLDWDAQTANFVAQSTANEDAGYYSVFKDPLRAAMRWREELAPNVIERIMAVVARSSLGRTWFADDLPD
jgi:hypothetical protein